MEFNLFENAAGNKLEKLKAICKNLPGVFKDFKKQAKN
jgi:hypothetical protein